MDSHLEFAISKKVDLTVIDCEEELYKIARAGHGSKKMSVLIRLTTDDSTAVHPMSKKFGCPVEKVPYLLEIAKALAIDVKGVSFHVGSGCGNP